MSKVSLKDISVFHPFVLVEPIEKQTEKTSNSGIVMPTQEENVIEARVVVSSFETLLPHDTVISPISGSGGSSQRLVQKGEVVFIKRFISYPIADTKYRFVHIEDIMGVKEK